jgi:lipid-binding SYLF domain-containing protein
MMKSLSQVLIVALAFVVPAIADTSRQDDVRRLENAAEVFHDVMHMPDKGIPDKLLRSAHCIAIIPGEKKAAFFVGGNYGKGMVTCRDREGWSAPLFLTVGGGSFGFQWGATSTDLILVFRGKEGLEKLLSDKFEVGATAEAAAGPVGRDAAADTDIAMHAEILTYSRSKGIFAGISLKGAVLQPDDSGNEAFYGKAGRDTILSGGVPVPASARPLLREIAAGAGVHDTTRASVGGK